MNHEEEQQHNESEEEVNESVEEHDESEEENNETKAEVNKTEEEQINETDEDVTFKDLGLNEILCDVCNSLKWTKPTKIQKETLPYALEGKDIIGLAETGSGKTGAFALPILNKLLENNQRLFAIILTPTRELAIQIKAQFQALGESLGVESVAIVGGLDKAPQEQAIKRKPHIIIATPGRLVEHLETTKGFSLNSIKYLVLDEADRILNLDFEKELDQILRILPKKRNTYLFSATMTSKVRKLERASLNEPVRIEVSSKYQTVDNLKQYYIFMPDKFKDVYLSHILIKLAGNSFIVFTNTCSNSHRLTFLLRNLGLSAIPLFGKMNQTTRLGSLNKFKSKSRSILIATDVASRGLDIPHVDIVINYDLPSHSKDYIHRVGRTARAGKSGKSITLVTQYDVELFQRIEHLIDKKLDQYEIDKNEVMSLVERVSDAQRNAKAEMDNVQEEKGRKRSNLTGDKEEQNDAIIFKRDKNKKFKNKKFKKK